jgi:hypothetical protein
MTTEQQSRANSPRRGLVIGLVATVILAGAAVTVLAVILLGRSPATAGDDASPTPTTIASASGGEASAVSTASVTAAATAEPTPQPLAPDTMALVMVNDLNMREEPASGAKSLGHLTAGTRVFVVQGPNQADGLGWYEIAQECRPHSSLCISREGAGRIGWAAGSSSSGDQWLAPAPIECAAHPDLDALLAIDRLEVLACYGNQTLRLQGVIWRPCCGYVGAISYEPSWLSWPGGPPVLTTGGELSSRGIVLRIKPPDTLDHVKYADIVRVTGHFDDPAAETCTITVDPSADPSVVIDPKDLAYAPMGCRMEFVVDSIKVDGNTGQKCEC